MIHSDLLRNEKRALGRVMREAREKKGWTQQRLAKQVGVRPSYISHLENTWESQSLPSFDVYFQVLWTLGYQCEIIVAKR